VAQDLTVQLQQGQPLTVIAVPKDVGPRPPGRYSRQPATRCYSVRVHRRDWPWRWNVRAGSGDRRRRLLSRHGRIDDLENGDVVRFWEDLNMTEIPARLSIVTLGARDMDALRSFYRTLGWPELPNGDSSWTGFLLGGVLLALFPLSDLTAEAAPDSKAPTGWSGVTLACTVGTRDEVDSAFDAAVTAGAAPVAAATDRSWGGRSAFVADPEGNRWEITWSPRATYDARGALLSWG
jgi:uncharacterized protein